MSAHCSTMASCSCRSTAAAAPSTSPTTRAAGAGTASKRTVAKRRTRSTESSASIAMPGASAGTRNWVSPVPVRAVTSSSSACAAASTGVAIPSSTKSSPSRVAVTRDARGVPTATGTGDAPRTDDLAGDDPGQAPGPAARSNRRRPPRRRRRWWAERSGRHQPAHLLGDDHEVEQTLAAEAAPAVGLGHEERRPPELGAPRPPARGRSRRGCRRARAPR